MPKTAKKCITHVAQTGKAESATAERERVTEKERGGREAEAQAASLLWALKCRRRGHKKQFSESGSHNHNMFSY